jgi:glycosyltransferase involved in cell wall biosynthesis
MPAASRVTVLMPVYNAERYLRPAIDSILSQTFRDFEFLIVNDGSSDNSRKIVESYADPRIKLVDNPHNMGLTRTLNRGLGLATGELIARQDADDVSYPDRLRRQVEFLDAHRDTALVGTQTRVIDEDGRPSGLRHYDRCCEYESIRWDLLFGNSFTHSSVMFRRTIVAEEMGGYDETFKYEQDYDLWSRVACRYRVMNIPLVLVDYRIHPLSMSNTMRGVMAEEHGRVIRRHASAVLGGQAVTNEDVDLIVRATVDFRKDALKPFLALFRRILDAYQRLCPAVLVSNDFRLAVARQFLRLAYRAWRANPYLVWRVLAESIVRYPVLRVSLSWSGSLVFARASRLLDVPSHAPLAEPSCRP